MRYLLRGERFDPATALRIGLVSEVVPAGQQLERADAVEGGRRAPAPRTTRSASEIGAATDSNGYVIVVDRNNHRVQKFGCQ